MYSIKYSTNLCRSLKMTISNWFQLHLKSLERNEPSSHFHFVFLFSPHHKLRLHRTRSLSEVKIGSTPLCYCPSALCNPELLHPSRRYERWIIRLNGQRVGKTDKRKRGSKKTQEWNLIVDPEHPSLFGKTELDFEGEDFFKHQKEILIAMSGTHKNIYGSK